MKPSVTKKYTVRRAAWWNKNAIIKRDPCIKMMYQLASHFGHRREWGLDWVSIVLSFGGYVLSARCKKFEGNFTMTLCSFGGVSDQRGATSWAAYETGMVPLWSSELDMTEWLKEKGLGTSRARGRPGHINWPKLQVIQNISLKDQTRAQMAFIAIQWTLFIATICYHFVVSNGLFVTKIFRRNLLGSCEEKLTFNKLFMARAKGLTKIQALKGKSTVISSQQSREPKTTIRITSRLFFVSLPCLFTFRFTCVDAYHAITFWAWNFTVFLYLWFCQRKIFANMLHWSFLMKLTFYVRKCLVSRITFLVTKIIWIHVLITYN